MKDLGADLAVQDSRVQLASGATQEQEASLASLVPQALQVPRASQENWALRDLRDQLALQERWDPRGHRVQWERLAFLGTLG